MRQQLQRPVAILALAFGMSALASAAKANLGTQIPLNQMQAGTEVTTGNVVVNGGFESPIGAEWTSFNGMTVGAPLPTLPNPPGAVGNFTAQGGLENAIFSQVVTLQPNTDYVMSGYIWNYGVAGPNPPNDLNIGDITIVELVGGSNPGISIEPIALDSGSGSNGYFVYETFNSSSLASLTPTLEVEVDLEGNPGTQRPPVVGQFDNIAITPAANFVPPQLAGSTWNFNGSGNWSEAGKWSGTIPDAVGAVAIFGNAISNPATVTLDSNRVIGTANFNSAISYTIGGTSTLTLDATSGIAAVNVIGAGAHEIAANVHLADPTIVDVAAAASSMRLSGDMTAAATAGLGKTGPGLLEAKHVRADLLHVAGGTVKILANGTSAASSKVHTLTVDSGTTLDVTNNAFVVDYGTPAPGAEAEPFDTIRARIVAAYNGGAWDQPGITSSMANSSTFAVGYAEASALTTIPSIFLGADSTSVLFRYTRYGDADLSGNVNSDDFNRLASNFGLSGKVWTDGDFNFSGTVNSDDFNLLASSFGLSAGADGVVDPEDWAALAAAVPEPTSALIFVGLATSAANFRRGRR